MRINVTRSSMPDFEEFCQEIRPLWDSHWLTNNGEKLLELQSRLEAYLDVGHLSLFTNGHLALEALLEALDLRGEVITTPFTFASTTHALVRKGLTPVFCDIRESDYTLDPELLEGLITERTCAILPVHVYGCLCDADAIQAIADRHGLKVIYDAAHAFGVSRNGVSAARLGLASCSASTPRRSITPSRAGRSPRSARSCMTGWRLCATSASPGPTTWYPWAETPR